jgi:hypothetical protein
LAKEERKMLWSNRCYYTDKGKIILGKGLDGMPLIKLYAPKETSIYYGINKRYIISIGKGNTYYINKRKDDKIFLLINLGGNIDKEMANIYVAERNEHNIKILDFRSEFDENYNLQKILIIEIIDHFPIFFRIEYLKDSISDQYISVVRGRVYDFNSNSKELIKSIDWKKIG